uniref:Uncharacterized protein n=1 Tax=Rhizobium rhizogenes TaxID=359 RepID=A0A7S5DQ51_RHIRH|nr:hypothetical protein pC5.7b_321 [Rhizobium rhizogenes]
MWLCVSPDDGTIANEKAKVEGERLTRPLPSLATRPSRSDRGLASAQVDMSSVAFLNG